MNNNIQLLKELATGIPVPKDIEAVDEVGKKHMDISESFLQETKIKDKKLKFRGWRTKVKDWQFTPNNVEYYWDTYSSLYPAGKEAGKKAILNETRDKFNALTDDIEKESYIKDNIRNWPEWLTKEVEPWFMTKQAEGLDKTLFRARIISREATGNALSNLKGTLNHEVSSEAHIEDYIKAKAHGYEGHITIEGGRFSIPLDGERVPAYTLERADSTLTEEFIAYNDDRPIVKTKINALKMDSRKEAQDSERAAIESSYKMLGSYVIPDEFQDDIILDHAIKNDFSQDSIWEGLDRIMQQKLEEGSFHRIGDASRYYITRYRQLADKLSRRL